MKTVIAGCGSTIREEDDWVCPYFCRRDEWKKQHSNHGCCEIDLVCGTNQCLHAPKEEYR